MLRPRLRAQTVQRSSTSSLPGTWAAAERNSLSALSALSAGRYPVHAGLGTMTPAEAIIRAVSADQPPGRRRPWPAPRRLPLQPLELTSAGLCATHAHREWWTSGSPPQRAAAAEVCGCCPVIRSCRAWSLTLPPGDNAVYAAMGAKGRRAGRQAAGEPFSAFPGT